MLIGALIGLFINMTLAIISVVRAQIATARNVEVDWSWVAMTGLWFMSLGAIIGHFVA